MTECDLKALLEPNELNISAFFYLLEINIHIRKRYYPVGHELELECAGFRGYHHYDLVTNEKTPLELICDKDGHFYTEPHKQKCHYYQNS